MRQSTGHSERVGWGCDATAEGKGREGKGRGCTSVHDSADRRLCARRSLRLSLPLPLPLRSAALIESQLDHDERRDATIDSIRTAENGLYTFEVTQHDQTRMHTRTQAELRQTHRGCGRGWAAHTPLRHTHAHPPLLLLLLPLSCDDPTASRAV